MLTVYKYPDKRQLESFIYMYVFCNTPEVSAMELTIGDLKKLPPPPPPVIIWEKNQSQVWLEGVSLHRVGGYLFSLIAI